MKAAERVDVGEKDAGMEGRVRDGGRVGSTVAGDGTTCMRLASNQVPRSMVSRNRNVVRGTLLKLGFNTMGRDCSHVPKKRTNVPVKRNVALFPRSWFLSS